MAAKGVQKLNFCFLRDWSLITEAGGEVGGWGYKRGAGMSSFTPTKGSGVVKNV